MDFLLNRTGSFYVRGREKFSWRGGRFKAVILFTQCLSYNCNNESQQLDWMEHAEALTGKNTEKADRG